MYRRRLARAYNHRQTDQAENLAIVRRLRQTHGRIPDQVADFILQNQGEVPTSIKAWRFAERISLILLFGVIVASTSMGLSMAAGGIQSAAGSVLNAALQDPNAAYGQFMASQTLNDVSGYLAAAAMLLTFNMTRAIPMRVLALTTNALFLVYAIDQALIPVILLHAVLMPLNLRHLVRAIRAQLAVWTDRVDPDCA